MRPGACFRASSLLLPVQSVIAPVATPPEIVDVAGGWSGCDDREKSDECDRNDRCS